MVIERSRNVVVSFPLRYPLSRGQALRSLCVPRFREDRPSAVTKISAFISPSAVSFLFPEHKPHLNPVQKGIDKLKIFVLTKGFSQIHRFVYHHRPGDVFLMQ